MTATRSATLAAPLAALLAWPSIGRAEEKSRDEGLDSLLKKLDDSRKSPDGDAAKPAAPGEVAPKDQALDSLLEKLGETKETPAPDDKGRPQPRPADEPADASAKPDAKPADDLKGEAKDLDEHLKELTGRKEKKKDQKEKDGESGGPLGQIIEEMREVEQRLGKPDTGEETRKKQTEIVKNLESLIEQLKQSSSQSQAMRMLRQKGKPGQPQSGQPGALAQGAPPMRPEKPKGKPPIALNKDIWGHLQGQLREEMENVFKEEMLPAKQEQIRQYLLSVAKKALSREE